MVFSYRKPKIICDFIGLEFKLLYAPDFSLIISDLILVQLNLFISNLDKLFPWKLKVNIWSVDCSF